MGTIYYGVCHDCKQYIDLDKFYSWSAYPADDHDYADIDQETLQEYHNDGFIYRSLRLHFFMTRHRGHRIGVYTEHEIFDRLIEEEYEQVYPWPGAGEKQADIIDFTDPKADRLVIKTVHGDIFLDVRSDGINCFRFINGERVDTLVLPFKKPLG